MKNPVFKINEHGEWYYNNSLISRKALVKLFSTVLTRFEDGTFHLKTPVEDIEIDVVDVPFIVIDFKVVKNQFQKIIFETNVGDIFELGKNNPLWVEKNLSNKGLIPYVLVRSGIIAKLSRSVYYNLVSVVTEKKINGSLRSVIESNNHFFELDLVKKRKFLIEDESIESENG